MARDTSTPRDIVQKLNREIVTILHQKDTQQEFLSQGALPVGDTPEHFTQYIKDEIVKWGAVVRSANIKVD